MVIGNLVSAFLDYFNRLLYDKPSLTCSVISGNRNGYVLGFGNWECMSELVHMGALSFQLLNF